MSSSIVVEQKPATTEKPAAELKQEAPPAAPESELPEKYRGKSIADIVRMHQEAESELGRSRNEVGIYRDLTHEVISAKRTGDLKKAGMPAGDEQRSNPITPDALLSDPDSTVRAVIRDELKQAIRPVEEEVKAQKRSVAMEQFLHDFPDFNATTTSPEFQSWLAKSQIRQEDAYNAAHGDLRAARRLMEDYAEIAGLRPAPTVEQPRGGDKPTGVEGARKSATEGASGGGDNQPRGEVFKKSEVLKLALHDTEKYRSADFQRRFHDAVKSGRYIEDA